jgi:hypothetical protein
MVRALEAGLAQKYLAQDNSLCAWFCIAHLRKRRVFQLSSALLRLRDSSPHAQMFAILRPLDLAQEPALSSTYRTVAGCHICILRLDTT